MINQLIRFSVKNKLIIGTVVLLWILWGGWSYTQLSIDAVPDITNNQVQVVTISPSLAPQEVEKFITYPIEISMANIPKVEDIRSISRFGLSVITIVFEEGYDIMKARQFVNEQLQLADIPEKFGKPELMPITTGLGEVFQYSLEVMEGYEDQFDAMKLREIQDWIVKRQLSGIEGVVEVSSFGGYVKEFEVVPDPIQLRFFDLSMDDVQTALALNNSNTGGGYTERGGNAFFIRVEGRLNSLKDIENVVVSSRKNIPLLIKDIAKVRYGHALRYGAMTKDGKGEVVGGITLMLKGSNASKTIANIKERIEQVKKSLPEGVNIKSYLDRSELVDRVINTVKTNLLEGGLIVIFILVLMLGNVRAGFIVASVIPLSLLFAFGMMQLFGVSANLMSLGAIDFGLVVDGSVIVIESAVHFLRIKALGGLEKMNQEEMDDLVISSSSKIRKSAAFGEIIILIVYLPILTLQGVEGRTFKPMAMTVSFAILGALILSMTYVPMMSSLLFKKKLSMKETIADRFETWMQKVYKPILEWVLERKTIILTSSLVLLIGSGFMFNRLGAEFVPTLEEGDLAMQMVIKPGSSLTESIETSTKAEKILLEKFPEVKHVVSKIGTAEVPTDPMSIEDADVMVVMKPKDEWTSADDREEMVMKMKESLKAIIGANFDFTQPIQLRFNELMTGVKSDLAVKIYGEDLNELVRLAGDAAKIIRPIQGVADLQVERAHGLPQWQIYYNRINLAKYGIKVEDVNMAINTAMAGQKSGEIYEGERHFDIVVRLDNSYRKDPEFLNKIYVRSVNQQLVPVSEVATLEIKEGPIQISREDTRRFTYLGINVRGRDVKSLVEEINLQLDSQLKLPAGYYITYGGQFENLENATKRLAIVVPIALLLIALLLFFTFKSVKQTLMIFSAIPLAAIGGVVSLGLRGMPFSISAGVGFIALFGVAVLNGIVLIAHFNQLKKEGIKNVRERVVQGAQNRIRPVLMTASVASLGFLPMAISSSAGAEVQQPLATVVIGGLITATFLTLIVLPILYELLEEKDFSLGRGNKMLSIIVIVSLVSVLPHSVKAQQVEKISMEEALSLAMANNPYIKMEQKKLENSMMKQKTAFELGKTMVQWQYGQFNSFVIDNGVQISQNFGNPFAMSDKKKLYKTETQIQSLTLDQRKVQLQREVANAYSLWLWYKDLEDLYIFEDSLFTSILEKEKNKVALGESSELTMIKITTRLTEITSQKNRLEAEKKKTYHKLKVLLYSDKEFEPKTVNAYKLVVDTLGMTVESLPTVQTASWELTKSEKNIKFLKSGWYPELYLSFGSMSIDKQWANEYFSAGLSIPLFSKQRRKVQMAEIEQSIKQSNFEFAKVKKESELKQFLLEWQKQNESLQYLESELLPNAQKIERLSTNMYQEGELGYMDHILNLTYAIGLRIQYLESLKSYNQSVINLNYRW